MFKFIKKGFIVFLSSGGSLATKCISLNNELCLIRPIFIDLYSDELRYYLFIVSLDRCNGCCNTFDDPSGRTCVPNKVESVNTFNMITRINVSKVKKQ